MYFGTNTSNMHGLFCLSCHPSQKSIHRYNSIVRKTFTLIRIFLAEHLASMHIGIYISNMHGYISRHAEQRVQEDLSYFPVVAVVGPRQCGKSTMIKHMAARWHNFIYLDLENPADLNKLADPLLFFNTNADKTICLDEIQRKPDLFPILRSVTDARGRPGQFLVLGSASPDLLKQTSESLAGRISFIELTPFTYTEINHLPDFSLHRFWLRGGYPAAYLAPSDDLSYRWRENFIRTFIERDIPMLGFPHLSVQLHRFLLLCAHSSGQVANLSKLGEAMGVSHHTIRRYLDVLEKTYILRILPPWYSNLKKRLVKSPKLYFRDSGILLTLLKIQHFDELLGHPIIGASWETFAIENILNEFPDWDAYFYRTSNGAEIDLLLIRGNQKIAVEFKASTTPKPSRGFFLALKDLNIQTGWLIAPIPDNYPIKENIYASNLEHFIQYLKTDNP